ncbi:MAG: helix-turn-helix domain-containing protein [Candidatus Bipolaricaulia bacterium]
MKDLGRKLRALRRQRGLTLEEVSAHCGLSVSFLSQVERGISSPSIVSLHSICRVLGVPISEVLTDAEGSPSTVTKAADQPQIRIANSAVSYRYLSGAFPERVIEVLINEFPPNYRHPLAPHEGEEFGYVLEGHLILRIGEEEYPLGPGDSYHFLASKPHGYETSAREGAKVLMATTQKFIEWHTEMRRESFAEIGG